jgi:hypothetical protein
MTNLLTVRFDVLFGLEIIAYRFLMVRATTTFGNSISRTTILSRKIAE